VTARNLSGGGGPGFSGLNERMLTTLLSEMDGVDSKQRIVFVAATNNIAALDKVRSRLSVVMFAVVRERCVYCPASLHGRPCFDQGASTPLWRCPCQRSGIAMTFCRLAAEVCLWIALAQNLAATPAIIRLTFRALQQNCNNKAPPVLILLVCAKRLHLRLCVKTSKKLTQ